MRTTVIINCKGGVGKTITTVNMAAELAARGRRVCVVDADPQCNATDFLMVPSIEPEWTLFDLLTSLRFYHYETYLTSIKGVSLVYGDDRLSLADLAALQKGGVRLSALREFAEDAAENDVFDHILVDCPPGFTAASTAALAAADDAVIPMTIDAFAIGGEAYLVRQIGAMREFNPRLRIAGVLVTMNEPRTKVSREGMALLRESAIPVFNNTIPRSTQVPQSTFWRKPLREMKGADMLALQYQEFVTEFLGGAK